MSLAEVRRNIDRLDDQIVALLAERQRYVIEAARYKVDEDAVRAPERRRRMMERLGERAEAEGLDTEVVRRVYQAMIDTFIDVELRRHRSSR